MSISNIEDLDCFPIKKEVADSEEETASFGKTEFILSAIYFQNFIFSIII